MARVYHCSCHFPRGVRRPVRLLLLQDLFLPFLGDGFVFHLLPPVGSFSDDMRDRTRQQLGDLMDRCRNITASSGRSSHSPFWGVPFLEVVSCGSPNAGRGVQIHGLGVGPRLEPARVPRALRTVSSWWLRFWLSARYSRCSVRIRTAPIHRYFR